MRELSKHIWGRAFQAKGMVNAKGESKPGMLRDKRQPRVADAEQSRRIEGGKVRRVLQGQMS